ncbi:CobW family GTP-binding protein [Alteribacter natronophilus]|uniref:CobW family GTP-binding protein n=1 Tax=Alteribacter natronophilus TaxID=2583810 RepID=UPI0014872ADB|nr:GTP-binding protein [Alteribacter natronophilus]
MGKIPIMVLSGFLGSGKTTLLKRVIRKAEEDGLKISVLMNEIGQTDTDGRMLTEEADLPVEKLLDGCMCCNKKSEVSGAVLKLAETQPDLIVVELTGVADPEEVADALSEPILLDKVYLQRIVSVLDGENLLDYSSIFTAEREIVRTIRKQMTYADTLIVNKEDQVTPENREKISRLIAKENPEAPVTFTSYCNVDLSQTVFGGSGRDRKVNAAEPHDSHDHKARVTTVKLNFPGPVKNKRAVEKFIKSLRPRLVRAKGYVPVKKEDRLFLMQHVMKKTYWERAEEPGESYLILIGVHLDEEEVKKVWENVKPESPHNAGERRQI